jgi:hypothetical protein
MSGIALTATGFGGAEVCIVAKAAGAGNEAARLP